MATGVESLSELVDRVKQFMDQTSVNLYDLLPPEDREAIEWVRGEGGLPFVKAACNSYVDTFESYTVLRDEVAKRAGGDLLQTLQKSDNGIMAMLDRRLVPDCILTDFGPVRVGDMVMVNGFGEEEFTITEFVASITGRILLKCKMSGCEYAANFHPEEITGIVSPNPKVLDADGVEVEVGDDLYTVEGMLKFHVSAIDKKSGRIATEAMFALDKWADPKMYTHRVPVLAADGKPLREGEHVYHVETGVELVVKELPKPWEYQAVVVFAPPASHLTSFDPNQLTHQRPDSWERLEEDATKDCWGYWGCETRLCTERCPNKVDGEPPYKRFGVDDCCDAKAVDLVRRAKALARVSE